MRRGAITRAVRLSPALSRVATAWHLVHTALILVRARIGHVLTRLQQRGQKGDGTVWTRVASRSLIATPVESFRSVDAAAASLAGLLTALDTAGVTGKLLVSPPELARVAVSDVPEALAALASASDNWYIKSDAKVTPLRCRNRFEPLHSALVFRAWATADGRFLAGADVGVELVTKGGGDALGQAPSFPVDAVITWVDGSDPQWQARRRARRAEVTDELHPTADNEARYESLDELKYCLRSIEMYAPWIRRIFLVTDQQVPVWLDPADERVTLVDHTDIFDNSADLPTFNSHAIESRLHHIPGLAEHWIYFNDDVFLARALPPSFFFASNGCPKVFLADDEIDEGPRTAFDPPVVAAAKNNRAIIRRNTGYLLQKKLKHVPHPQQKTLAAELEARAPDSLMATSKSPFRTSSDLSMASSLMMHFGLATQRAEASSIRHFYADVASPELRWRLPKLRERRDIDAICLNETTQTTPEVTPLQRIIKDLYPLPSPWEHVR